MVRSHVLYPKTFDKVWLVALQRHLCSSISEGGTAHSSHANTGSISICRCWPIINNRRKILSRSITSLNCLSLTCFLDTDIVVIGPLLGLKNPLGRLAIYSLSIFSPIRIESATFTLVCAIWPVKIRTIVFQRVRIFLNFCINKISIICIQNTTVLKLFLVLLLWRNNW